MASATDIANRALQKLGSSAIMSITDPGKNPTQCKLVYDDVRDQELRKNVWSFAVKRAALAADTDAPAYGYDLAYSLPSDFLRLVEIDGASLADMSDYRGADVPTFRIEGRRILTNLSAPLDLRYLEDGDDTGRVDPRLRDALICRMAAELAEPLTQSLPKKQLCLAEYKDAVKMARRTNAIENTTELAPDDSWIMARL